MSKLFKIDQYSKIEIESACLKSEALLRYLNLLKEQKNTDLDLQKKNRHQVWIECALSCLLHKNTAQEICLEWSHLADQVLRQAFEKYFDAQQFALFALGKLGAEELNLSSDVDLLILSLNENADGLSALRQFQKYLSEKTMSGFIFRVDFDLRPGGKHGPLIATLEQFKDYYGNYGEAWERLALVRLRPLAGSTKIIQDALSFAEHFCYRRHLDFTLLEDLKSLRKKIHAEYWKRTQDNQVDLKLGVGGIRDIELFVHALLVIHGGKNISIRDKGTTAALQKIQAAEILPKQDCDFLIRLYWELRDYENQVQAISDSQTHLMQNPPTDLKNKMEKCSALVSGLIGELPELNEEYQKAVSNLPPELQEYWSEIVEIHALSRNKDRDEQTRLVFLQKFFTALQARRANIPQALVLLKDFIRATRAKASFFTLLVREEKLLEELAWIFGQSPYLARILCFRPELLDSFVYRSQELTKDDLQLLLEQLAEKKQLSEVINGSEFLRTKDVQRLCQNLSTTADEILNLLISALKKEYPSDVSILALGKWGGSEMGLCSDLDFIFVTPQEPIDADFKFAKRMISRLTEPHKGGSIYPIDMRLRPSGSSGPLVVSAHNLQEYLKNSTAPWECQAYLKGRWIGPTLLHLSDLLNRELTNEELKELNRIRIELISKTSSLNLKYAAGGLIDVEFATQVLCLKKHLQLKSGNTLELMKASGLPEFLLKNYLLLRQYEQLNQLFTTEATAELNPNHESFHSLATLLNFSSDDFKKHLSLILSQNIQILEQLDPRRLSS